MGFYFSKGLTTAAVVIAGLLASTSASEALDRRVRIVNETGYTIVKFYASHRDMTTWGYDHLGNNVLHSGYNITINFNDGSGYCIYDFRAEFSDGEVLEKRGVNVCEIGTYTYY